MVRSFLPGHRRMEQWGQVALEALARVAMEALVETRVEEALVRAVAEDNYPEE
jgi:hypothetical protein